MSAIILIVLMAVSLGCFMVIGTSDTKTGFKALLVLLITVSVMATITVISKQ
jgi:hypothetical protein